MDPNTPANADNKEQADNTSLPATTPAAETPATPPVEAGTAPLPPQEHDWKKRYEDTAQSHKEKSEQFDRALNAQSQIVQNNPAYLEDLAKADKTMADEVAKKVYGQSYEDYQASQKIKEMRETDPESADREERLRALERSMNSRQQEEKTKFLETKGINANKFDPAYQKFEEQLSVLDKKFVENNYSRALEIAHGLAFAKTYSAEEVEKAKQDAILGNQANKAGGGMATDAMGAKAKMTGEAANFNSAFKAALQNNIS